MLLVLLVGVVPNVNLAALGRFVLGKVSGKARAPHGPGGKRTGRGLERGTPARLRSRVLAYFLIVKVWNFQSLT